MKYFVMSDIHGDYNAMMKGIKKSGYDKTDSNHQIIVIGDYFGRADTGEGSYGIFKYLTSDEHKNKPICLKGNHEETFVQKIFERGYVTMLDQYNGEDNTVLSFYRAIPNIYDDNFDYTLLNKYFDERVVSNEDGFDRWAPRYLEEETAAVNIYGEGSHVIDWVKNMPYYFETKNYVFTHGWLPFRIRRTKELDMDEFPSFNDYMRAMDETAYISYEYKDKAPGDWYDWIWGETPDRYSIHKRYLPNGWDKWIVVGHWHAFAFGKKGERYGDFVYNHLTSRDYNYVKDDQHKVIFCDQCTAKGHKINVLILEDEPLDEEKEVKNEE